MMLEVACATVVVLLTLRWLLRRLTVRNFNSKYIFITGCDTGFGHDLAVSLDRLGFRVIAGCLTEKGGDSLRKEASQSLCTLTMDVTSDDSIAKAVQFVKKKLPPKKGLWALVNNAGVSGMPVPAEWLPKKDIEHVMNVNLLGVMYTTMAFLPLLRRAGTPARIVNISSIMGRFTIAPMPYSASKFGVEGMSDCLRMQLYKTGISVHLIEPGYFGTGIVTTDSLRRDIDARYQQLDPSLKDFYGEEYKDALIEAECDALSKIMSTNTNAVVEAFIHAISARFPKARYVVGWDANILFRLLWNLPEWMADFLVNLLLPTPKGYK